MANSVFHTIYTENIDKAINNQLVENYKAMGTIGSMYLTTVLNTFKWGNLPNDCIPRNPELFLCYWGMMSMFYDDENKLRIFPTYPSGQLLDNGEYTEYTAVSLKGSNWRRKRDEIALCYNNFLGIPSIYSIEELAKKSTNALRAVDSALERSMIPAIIECDTEEDMNQLSDLYDRTKNGLPYRLKFKDGFNANGCSINDIFDSRKYDMLQMWDVYVRYRNLFYTSFGINNVEIQKRERLTEAEGSGNDEITRYTLLNDMRDRRQDFINECKEKFNYELTLEVNRDSATVYNLTLDNEDKIEDVQLNILRGINTQSVKTDESEVATDGDEDSKDVTK